MRTFRVAFAIAVLLAAWVGATPAGARAGTIEGALTLGNGSGYAHGPTVTVHAPATSSAPIEFVELLFVNDVSITGKLPYVESFDLDVSQWSWVTMRARWYDSEGATAYSDVVELTVLDFWPDFSIQSFRDGDTSDEYYEIGFNSNSYVPIPAVRFSPDGTTWGEDVAPTGGPYNWEVRYPVFDPVYGGKAVLGDRAVWMKIMDAAGAWSKAYKRTFTATVDTTILVSPKQPLTGHKATFTPAYPQKTGFPTGSRCMWEFMWGNPQSLYYGNRDETFGFFYTYGPKSGGYCDPRSFTMPWMPYPRMLVHFEAYGPDGETIADAWIGESPEAEAVIPAIDSTSRRITYSNVPMVYVLPDDYILELGKSTTYRAYSLGGAPLAGGSWSADFAGDAYDRFKSGGSSWTFTPQTTGFVTVCWGSDTTKSTRWSACYDPPVKRKDLYRPTTTKPVQTITSTNVMGSSVPVTLTWNGADRGWGIAKYQLERRVDGGAWKRILSRKTRSLATTLAPGHAYQFRVRAIDRYGNVGYWDIGPSFRPTLVEDGSTAIVYTGDWASAADATARGGSIREASASASKAVLAFTGRDVAWLAERGPGHGVAKVYVDGALAATVDLNAAADAPARVVFRKHWGTKAGHALRIVVQGTAGRPVVGVDGFAVLR